jgi:hypothetical protein
VKNADRIAAVEKAEREIEAELRELRALEG